MKTRILCILLLAFTAFTAFGQEVPKYTCDFYTESGTTVAYDRVAPYAYYLKYGFGATFNKTLSEKFSVGVGFTGTKNVTANSYSIPIYLNMEYRALGYKTISPVFYARAGYSLCVPAQIASRDVRSVAAPLDYRWSDALYKEGKYQAKNDKGEVIENMDYSRALYIKALYGYEDDFEGVYYEYPNMDGLTEEQAKALRKEIDEKNAAMMRIISMYDYSSLAFPSGDLYYVNERRSFIQRGFFVSAGAGVDYKMKSVIVGLYANVGISDHFVGTIVSENNEYHYYDAIGYTNKLVKDANGNRVEDVPGDAVIVEGFSHHFYPQASITLRVRFW